MCLGALVRWRNRHRAPPLLGAGRGAWVDPENFARGPSHFFDAAPEHSAKSCAKTAQIRVAENYLFERSRAPRAGR